MADHSFPQSGDPDDAANFAEHLGRTNITDYVEYGLALQNIDYAALTFDVSEGKCFLLGDTETAASTGETRHRVDHVVHLDARAGLALTDGAVNHVFVDGNVGTNDSPTIVVNTTGAAPSDSSLKIGEIDTSADTATELNRDPSGDFEAASITDQFTVPRYASKADIPNDMPPGSIAYAEDEDVLYLEDGQ
jgi:hypothetical protein